MAIATRHSMNIGHSVALGTGSLGTGSLVTGSLGTVAPRHSVAWHSVAASIMHNDLSQPWNLFPWILSFLYPYLDDKIYLLL